MWNKSLKSKLAFVIILPILLTLLVVGTVSFLSAYEEIGEIYDAQLSHIAKLIYSLVRAGEGNGELHYNNEFLNAELERQGHSYEKNIAFRVWKNGKLLFASRSAENFDRQDYPEGFSEKLIGDSYWRFFVLAVPENGYRIDVAEKLSIRADLIGKILASIFSPIVLVVPLIFVISWFGLRSSLQPLYSVSGAVKSRSPSDLTPLVFSDVPIEITPLVNSINDLLARLDDALQKERRFTDYAAHELRTPIAVLKIQAQTALKSTSEQERRDILESHVRAADRATHMVEQLLTLSRLNSADIPKDLFSVNEVIKEVIEDTFPLAERKHIELNFNAGDDLRIHANHDILYIALRNIIDNAVKYTPDDGVIDIGIASNSSMAVISVSDSGPGIPEDKIGLVTERFYRVSGHKELGAGLGLSIVQRSADLMNATFEIRNNTDSHGLTVTLFLPRET